MKTSVFIADPRTWPHDKLMTLCPSSNERRVVFQHTEEFLQWDDLDKSLKVIIARETFGEWFCLFCMEFGEDNVMSRSHHDSCGQGEQQ